MKKAKVYVDNIYAGILTEVEKNKLYQFEYLDNYNGDSVSLAMPLKNKRYTFKEFPPFFDGLLPEGFQLEGLLKRKKIDKNDLFSQLIAVGADMIGNVTVKEGTNE